MSRLARILLLLLLAGGGSDARRAHHYEPDATPPAFKVGGLQFALPGTWQVLPNETPARVGHWLVPPPADQPGDGVEVVVFFFGPGVGGDAQENVEGWSGTIAGPDGSHPSPTPQKRTVAGHAVTEALFTGTYAQENPQAGLPPVTKSNYALLGEVIENPGGNIYWRATGPVAQVVALAPVLDKAVNGLKPATAAPAASP